MHFIISRNLLKTPLKTQSVKISLLLTTNYFEMALQLKFAGNCKRKITLVIYIYIYLYLYLYINRYYFNHD